MAALAARGDRTRADALSEFDHRDEAVAGGAVPFLRARLRARARRGQRTIDAPGERDWNAGSGVAERLVDRARDSLEPVDLAPRHLPAAELAGEPVGRVAQSLQLLIGRGAARKAHHLLVIGFVCRPFERFQQRVAPEHCQRLRLTIVRPSDNPSRSAARQGRQAAVAAGRFCGNESNAWTNGGISTAKPG